MPTGKAERPAEDDECGGDTCPVDHPRVPGHRLWCPCFRCFEWRVAVDGQDRKRRARHSAQTRESHRRIREAAQAERARRLLAGELGGTRGRPTDPLLHGTVRCWRRGCRCPECVEARRVEVRAVQAAAVERGLPDGDARHGTATGYNYFRCRCEKCRVWNRGQKRTVSDADRRRRARAERAAVGLPAGDPRHGTVYAYREWGCRCAPCTAANTESSRRNPRLSTPAVSVG